MNKWEDLKNKGSDHYKTGKIEPIDLYRSSGMLRHFVLGNIIKYSFRNTDLSKPVNKGDLQKIIHYAELLIAEEDDKREVKDVVDITT